MTPLQFKAARTVLGIGVHELAVRLKMGNSTIVKLESPGGLETARASTIHLLESFYRESEINFLDEGRVVGLLWPNNVRRFQD